MNFVNLHSHSYFSLLDGYSSPEELFDRAAELGMKSLAITDHGTLSSHRSAQRAAEKSGVKPILGLEAYFTGDRLDKRSKAKRQSDDGIYNHLIVLAKNQKGLENLQRLSEIAWMEGFYLKPRIDFEVLEKYHEGLIVSSGCMSGSIPKALTNGNLTTAKSHGMWFKEVFGGDFYIEIQPHNPLELNNMLLDFADDFDIKPIVTLDCHYSRPEDRVAEEIMLILGTHPSKRKGVDYEESVKYEDMMERLDYLYGKRGMSFSKLDIGLSSFSHTQLRMLDQGIDRADIFENTNEIADKIEAYRYESELDLLPTDHSDPDTVLRKRAFAGLKRRGFDSDQKYIDRLEEELKVIHDKKFSSYFLIVSNMVNWSKKQKILVGPARGSAAGSLLCYALGITEIDPLEYNLLFFRFINPERNDYPDIDLDFQDTRRDEVKKYLERQYKDVANIATFIRFTGKGIVRDVSRALHVPLSEVNKVLKVVDDWEMFVASKETQSFRNQYPEVVKYGEMLKGRLRGTGIHAAGIVTSKKPISNIAPIETRTSPTSKERVPVVGLDMEEVANIGLIKIDALGLKALSVISDALNAISDDVSLGKIPLDDKNVYNELTMGHTQGVFQCEAKPYTSLLMQMGVHGFTDLVASNALVRPGAMNTIGAQYLARKHGQQDTSFIHDSMKSYTAETFGTILYQEQVMQTCVDLGGMSMAEADKVRKVIGKKKDVHEFDEFKEKFITNASSKIDKSLAEKLWRDIEAHAGYSFNKSHAVAYSMLSYWTAWLKFYYPKEFMWALLVNEKDIDARTEYLIECKRLGLKIQLPHINTSDVSFRIIDDGIQFGLKSVKWVSDASANRIIAARPFKSFEHFVSVSKRKRSGINSRVVESLRLIGAASFEDNPRNGHEREHFYEILGIPEFTASAPEWVNRSKTDLSKYEDGDCIVAFALCKKIKRGKGWSLIDFVDSTGAISVFDDQATSLEEGKMYTVLISNRRVMQSLTLDDLRKEDRRNLGVINYLKSNKLGALSDNDYLVVSFKTRKTKSGERMSDVVMSSRDGVLHSAVVFPSQYRKVFSDMKPGSVVRPVLRETRTGGNMVSEIIKER